jgi:hypothetical protein
MKTEMVPTEGGGRIPARYQDFVDVFRKSKAETLPPHRPIDHAIDLEPGYKLPYGRIYNLLEVELKTLTAYIETHLASGFIQQSSSRAAAPILFAKKMDGGLILCVDYRVLNLRTVKNRYPLPQISELLDRVRGARIFTKLDIANVYHLIRIKEGDEYKTAFRTRYGQCEYRVMPFVLTNALATFQAYIDDCLRPYINNFTVYYLDDILIYLTNEDDHENHVRKVLERLREIGQYCKAAKCQFGLSEVGFLGFIINLEGVGMESDRISTIEDFADCEVSSRCASALVIHELLPEVYPEICEGNDSYIELAQDNRITKVGMDARCRTGISEAQESLHRNTDPPAFRPHQANHSAD